MISSIEADADVLGPDLAAGADPLSVGDLGQGGVETVDVVGGGAGVAAQQLSSVFAHAAVLDVEVVLLLRAILLPVLILALHLGEIVPGLPLDPLLLL